MLRNWSTFLELLRYRPLVFRTKYLDLAPLGIDILLLRQAKPGKKEVLVKHQYFLPGLAPKARSRYFCFFCGLIQSPYG
jgi:hypothetical protein